MGHVPLVSPLLRAVPLAWSAPRGVEAVVATSARALRAGDPGLATLRNLPCYVVGEATASAARVAGFADVRRPAAHGAAALWAALAEDPATPRRLLQLAGRDRTDAPVPDSFEVDVIETYAAELAALTDEAAARWSVGGIDWALIYSARTSAQLAGEAERLRLDRQAVSVGALSLAVAKSAGPGWRNVAVASMPDEDALFAAAGLGSGGCEG